MMAKAPKPAALQVLFEPWPASAGADREGYEVFAGHYLLDALDESGGFIDRGYRAVVAGCTTCRRSPLDDKVHYPNLNDLAPDKPKRRCPQWKKVEAIVKAFGGWKAAHYVELAENEGLHYQPVPQRRRVIEPCPVCEGSGLGKLDLSLPNNRLYGPCEAGCGSYGYGTKGEVQITYEGPVRPDRFDMTAEQRRVR
jgi:hypothetical protein